MTDRIIESNPGNVPDIPEVLEQALLFLIQESREMLEGGNDITPRTALVVGEDKLFEEEADADTVEACYARAMHTVRNAKGARAYGFVYDGYIEADDQTIDAIIAEGGFPGEPQGYALGLVYEIADDGKITFDDEPTYIGFAPNFMSELAPARMDRPAQEPTDAAEEADEGADADESTASAAEDAAK